MPRAGPQRPGCSMSNHRHGHGQYSISHGLGAIPAVRWSGPCGAARWVRIMNRPAWFGRAPRGITTRWTTWLDAGRPSEGGTSPQNGQEHRARACRMGWLDAQAHVGKLPHRARACRMVTRCRRHGPARPRRGTNAWRSDQGAGVPTAPPSHSPPLQRLSASRPAPPRASAPALPRRSTAPAGGLRAPHPAGAPAWHAAPRAAATGHAVPPRRSPASRR